MRVTVAWHELLRSARKQDGFPSDQAFADALRTRRRQVTRWETGRNLPGPKYRARIAALGPALAAAVAALSADPEAISALADRVSELEERLLQLEERLPRGDPATPGTK